MRNRIYAIDYLKCIFIILMIVFHLAYIGDKYPYIKQIVYTFHMPAFLIISGYLANINKKVFLLSIIWIFIPYAFMETGYVLASAVLPIREKIDSVSISLIADKMFLAPMGPYWYLHTLMVCYITYYLVHKISLRANGASFFILLGVCFGLLDDGFHILSMANALYFMAGVIINRCQQNFLSIFQPSVWGILPFVWLCHYPANLNRYSLAGIAITYLSISLSLWIYNYLPLKVRILMHFIGRNTLSIVLFSPIFTLISKVFIPFFSFDSSGFCFTCVAVVFVVTGSLTITWGMDKVHLSPYFFGKKQSVVK